MAYSNLVTTILIYNKNYLENGIHLRILRTLNTALEFIMIFRNLNNPKSNTLCFLLLEIMEHAYENRNADDLLISKRKGVWVESAKCALAKSRGKNDVRGKPTPFLFS